MENTVLTLHIIACIVLVLLVLLQSGKEGMGVIFGGGSSSLFGSTGAGGILVKLTTVAALTFLGTSLGYNILSSAKMNKESTIIDIEVNDPSAPPKPESPAAPTGTPASPAEPSASPAEAPATPGAPPASPASAAPEASSGTPAAPPAAPAASSTASDAPPAAPAASTAAPSPNQGGKAGGRKPGASSRGQK
ncbi:MAG: preprotein translocase subunit SecG [Desulfovibrio sp.]|nr:preprotein translocase subunit SecG [Desulfovibrio sp.]